MACDSVANVEHVVYAKKKDCLFTAVGVSSVTLSESDERLNEKCIFSQYLLRECDRIGGIVFSTTKGKQALEWRFVCSQGTDGTRGVHLFDLDYLKEYLDSKGADFTHCPLCKEGLSEEKEHLEEHDLDTMTQLLEKRDAAKAETDLPMRLFYENLIFDKACEEKWDPELNQARVDCNKTALKDTLVHWLKLNKIEEFRPHIVEGMVAAVKADNAHILAIIEQHCGYNRVNEQRRREWTQVLRVACAEGAFDCVKRLTRHQNLIIVEARPICLLNAIRTTNSDLVNEVIRCLEHMKKRCVGDDCFRECIKQDMVVVAKRLLELGWHKPRDEDYELAEKLAGSVWQWLKERRQQTMAYNHMTSDSGGLDWNDWDAGDDDDEEGNFEEDDDWS